MATLRDIAAATLRLRERTGDRTIGTRVRGGMVQIVRVTYDATGKATVEALSPYAPAGWIAHRLDIMGK
jgi:hypothetical protein